MAKMMHINGRGGSPQGFVFALCGKLLTGGAPANAKMCPKCARKAGR
jgi:hypothetical protein